MNKQFEGKVALVTGGSSGIGLAVAEAFAREGAKVMLGDVQEKRGKDVLERIRKEGGEGSFHMCDVSQSPQVQALVDQTLKSFGRLDFACNDAGIEGETAFTADCEETNWDRVIGINLKGVWLCMKYEIPAMLKNGGGAIVNISSIAGLVGFQGIPAYVASKHGVIGLTKNAALEYAGQGVRVNAVCPGVIKTPMVDRLTRGDAAAEARMSIDEPVGRVGKPEEIASAVIWLCSQGSAFTTGHSLVVDGGWVAQ